MEFTKIIIATCKLLKKENLLIYSQLNSESSVPASGGDLDEIKTLENCLCLVENEIACDYFPLRHEQVFDSFDGIIQISHFEKNFLEVEKLTNEAGRNEKFFVYPSFIQTVVGKLTIRYRYQPEVHSFGDVIENFGGNIPERVFAYGVAREFCFISGLYDDASMWDRRFTDAMQSLARIKGERKLKVGRWR